MSKPKKTTEAAVRPLRLVITPGNYANYQNAISGEPGGGISETQQKPSMSLEEIYFAYAQGDHAPLNRASREPIYTGDDYVPDFRTMDIEDVRQFRQDLHDDMMERIAAMDRATRELAIRDGVLPEDINNRVPLPPDPPPTPDPVPDPPVNP